MTSIRALIIDDERYAREELSYLLKQFEHVNVIGEVEQGEDAVIKVLAQEPDVVFLDVEMPKMNGIEVAKALTKLKHVPLIVFATAYPKFAAEAFRINAVDYLLKPYDFDQLTQAVDRVTQLLLPKESTASIQKIGKLPIEKEGEIDYIFVKDIIYIYPEGKISIVSTSTQQYEVKSSLKELENRLQTFNFFRIHRGFIVNLNYVKRLTPWFNGAYQLELEGAPEKLPVSRNYAKELQQRLEL